MFFPEGPRWEVLFSRVFGNDHIVALLPHQHCTEYVFIGKLDFKRVSDVYEFVSNSWKTMVLGQTTGEDFIEMEK